MEEPVQSMDKPDPAFVMEDVFGLSDLIAFS